MNDHLYEIADKHSVPTLDWIDQESGDRIKHFLFTEEGLLRFVKEIGERKESALLAQ